MLGFSEKLIFFKSIGTTSPLAEISTNLLAKEISTNLPDRMHAYLVAEKYNKINMPPVSQIWYLQHEV
jgi:hypothetical protein